MGTVTETMKIFLVTVLLSLTILSQTRFAGQHLLIETEAEDGGDDEGGAAQPPVGAGRFDWGAPVDAEFFSAGGIPKHFLPRNISKHRFLDEEAMEEFFY